MTRTQSKDFGTGVICSNLFVLTSHQLKAMYKSKLEFGIDIVVLIQNPLGRGPEKDASGSPCKIWMK